MESYQHTLAKEQGQEPLNGFLQLHLVQGKYDALVGLGRYQRGAEMFLDIEKKCSGDSFPPLSGSVTIGANNKYAY